MRTFIGTPSRKDEIAYTQPAFTTSLRLLSKPKGLFCFLSLYSESTTPLHTLVPQRKWSLLLSKPNRLFDRPGEFLRQRVEGLVRREVESVEASVRLGQLALLAGLLDREATRAIGTLEVLEAVDGDTRGSCGELEQTGFLLGVPAADAL